MRKTHHFELPPDRRLDLRRAEVLEWITLVYLASVVVLMYLVMGSSQAMKTAWVEDLLSFIPPIGFLIAQRVRKKEPDERYPYGYHRVVGIGFFAGSLALLTMGALLLLDSAVKLVRMEHPTLGSMELFGRQVWQGWPMLAVLVWAVVPVIFLGRAKIAPARRIHDKILFADATMNKADWLTGVAAMVGVAGIGVGWWWTDPVAAIVISLDVLRDGWKNVAAAVGDLMDREPQDVEHEEPIELPHRLQAEIEKLPWVAAARVRLRECGHVFFGDVLVQPRDGEHLLERSREVRDRAYRLDWRLHELVVELVRDLDGTALHPERQHKAGQRAAGGCRSSARSCASATDVST